MNVLVDTHTLLWAGLSPELLSRRAAETLADPENTALVSAASAWEIATKVRLGKLPGAEVFEREFLTSVEQAGYLFLSIDAATARRAGRLTGDHRDPFDRMIAAQALALDIPIVSSDLLLDSFSIRRIW